ncbi:unnamed protein product [Callosobruchus maculatus]|nr:unnamed protein product [Callosobruchus maculatus]
MNKPPQWIFRPLLLLSVVQATNSELLVTLNNPPSSTVRGHYETSYHGNRYRAFYEIPYASPPIGPLRYKEPVPAKPWNGVKGHPGPITMCPQDPLLNNTINVGTEDCLILNVYTPAKPSAKKLPVLLWIHGGGFIAGSNFFVWGLALGRYDPRYLIDEDIVIVTANYRLGPLGFLTTTDGVIPVNLGLKDQRLAIYWVKDNIELFGGDPNNIVLAGESAGAASVGYHLIATYKDLPIEGAILVSGSALCPWSYQTKARENAFELARTLDSTFKSNRSEDLLKLLQSATVQQIMQSTGYRHSQGGQTFNGALPLAWVPTIEQGDHFFSLPQTDAIDNGKFKKIPLLMGFNEEDAINPIITGNYVQKSLAWDEHPDWMLFENIKISSENKKELARKLKALYTNTSFKEDVPSVIKVVTDSVIAMPVIRFAESASKHAPVYMFMTSQTFMKHPVPGIEGVGHGEDMYYYWFNELITLTPNFEPTRTRFVKMISNFVKYK